MSGLCYSAPAHESWNLTHICRLVPESHTLFATPAGCSRIIRLSAIEKGISGQFTTLDITSADIIDGGVEEKILKGVRQTLCSLKSEGNMPRAMLIFISCVDTFIGTDHEYYLETLRKEFPEVHFLDCAMDPINREILAPIARMHLRISEVYTNLEKHSSVNFIGSFISPDRDNELIEHLAKHSIASRHIYDCKSMDDAEKMGGSMLNIVLHPTGAYAARDLERRTGAPWIMMPVIGDFDGQDRAYDEICSMLGIPPMDNRYFREACERELTTAAKKIKSAAISQDAYVMPCTLANTLVKYGFNVKKVFISDMLGDDEPAAKLTEKSGTEILTPDVTYAAAFSKEHHKDADTVAIGGDAAYYTKTAHSVSRIAFGGDFGYHSMIKLAKDMVYAAEHERDLKEITRPGKGCCCI